jgi:single-strand DNA-binding protein
VTDQQERQPAPGETGWEKLAAGAPRPATGQTGPSLPDLGEGRKSQNRVLGPGGIAGTLCADPELRFSQGGKAICKLRVAVQERTRDEQSGKWVDGPAEFVDVTVWNKQAEHATESLRKGDRVVVNGLWQEDTWFGRDEQWHSRRTLTAREVGPSLQFRPVNVIRKTEGSN